MGRIEKESKQRRHRENIQNIVLATIKASAIMSVGLLAPNVISALAKLGIIERNRNYRTSRTISTLLGDRLIKFEKTDRGTFVRLTPSGERKLYRQYERGKLIKPKYWDGKWRMVIYDLKEKKKDLREKLRISLRSFGFFRLQNSVWIYPYDCEDLITLMKADFKIGKDVLYIIADKIEYDKPLRKIFELPNTSQDS